MYYIDYCSVQYIYSTYIIVFSSVLIIIIKHYSTLKLFFMYIHDHSIVIISVVSESINNISRYKQVTGRIRYTEHIVIQEISDTSKLHF